MRVQMWTHGGVERTNERVDVPPHLVTRLRWRARRRCRDLNEISGPFARWEIVREDNRWKVVAFQNRLQVEQFTGPA